MNADKGGDGYFLLSDGVYQRLSAVPIRQIRLPFDLCCCRFSTRATLCGTVRLDPRLAESLCQILQSPDPLGEIFELLFRDPVAGVVAGLHVGSLQEVKGKEESEGSGVRLRFVGLAPCDRRARTPDTP